MPALPTAELFRTLADPTRLAIFERLAREGERSVGELIGQAGVSQPAVSQHLAVLRQAGLVRDRREGRSIRYRVAPEGLAPILDWFALFSAFWPERIDRLEHILKDMDQ